MSSVITNPFTPIPKSDKSHVKGWSVIWQQRLGASLSNKDVDLTEFESIYIDHGVNFSGSLNLFGGFNDEVALRVKNMIDAFHNGSKIFSLDEHIKSCNYVQQIEKRLGSKTTSDIVDFDFLEDLESMIDSTESVFMDDLESLNEVIIGDSHSAAFSDPNQMVFRNNGKTLWSALNLGIDRWIEMSVLGTDGATPIHPDKITICLGSIDIRFHCIKGGRLSADKYAKLYAKQVIKASQQFGIPFAVCAPVPVEHEHRKIPKTGQYDSRNFFGTRQERLDYTLKFIETLDNYFTEFDLVMPPQEWYEMDGEEYAKQIMEMSSSVHIAPKNYKSVLGW